MDFSLFNPSILVNPIKIQSWITQGFISNDTQPESLNEFINNHFAVKVKPFVKWVGGKRQLIKQFQSFYPQNFNPAYNTYYEPFVGGGAVFFDLQPYKAVLSDMNRELVITYNVIKNDAESLIVNLEKYVYKKEYYLKIRALDITQLSNLEIASRFIFLNRTGFNGLYRVNSKGQFNVPFGSYKNPKICDAENLRNVSKLLKNVDIKLQDYKQVLKNAQSGDFVYFDPPYYPVNKTSNFTSYTANNFLEKEQTELRDLCFDLHKKGCFVMLSNSNTDFINKLYSNLDSKIKVHKVDANRMVNSNANKRGKIKEVLVVNY